MCLQSDFTYTVLILNVVIVIFLDAGIGVVITIGKIHG